MVPARQSLRSRLLRGMQATGIENTCPDCLGPLVDAVDEMACQKCGVVQVKETVELGPPTPRAPSLSRRELLGSYMGSRRISSRERASRGLSGANSRYEYLKVLSDFAGREEGIEETCGRMVERVGEKLLLPRVVLDQARSIAGVVLASGLRRRRVTLAAVSAYALISACKVEGVNSASVREIIGAHVALGRRVSSSSIIQLSLESPVRTFARRPQEYLSRVMARLSLSRELSEKLRSERVSETVFFHLLRETALEILRCTSAVEMTGKRPCALAASAVYSAELVLSRCESRKKRLTQRELAECGDTAEYTIREQCARIFAPSVEKVATRRPHQ